MNRNNCFCFFGYRFFYLFRINSKKVFSISTITGLAPTEIIEATVANAEWAVVMTSSPCLILSDLNAIERLSVPFLVETANLAL